MNIFSDKYHFRARIIPQLLFILPFCLLFFHYVDIDLSVYPTFYFTLLLIVFSSWNFISKPGKDLQKKYKDQGLLEFLGAYILKIKDKTEQSRSSIERLHWQIFNEIREESGLDNPLDIVDLNEQKLRFDRIENWLRQKTRDNVKFPAVFDKNCSYGFYRNMLAMRSWAISFHVIAFLLLFVPLLSKYFFIVSSDDFLKKLSDNISSISILILLVILLLIWCLAITKEALQNANKGCLNEMLRSVDGIKE